jgi:sugar lactone lactonase YvrE
MMKKLLFLLTSLVFSYGTSSAQVGIGAWRDYLPYSNVKVVCDAGDRVYGATEYSVLEVDKASGELYRLSKITGLTETGVTAMGFHKATNTLLIGYEDGNIDLVTSGNVINVADILRANIIADKGIYNVYFYKNEAFLSCGFGIVRYDMERQEVRDSYYIGDDGSFLRVNDITVLNDTIFAATNEGLRYAPVDDAFLAFHETWKMDSLLPNFNSGFDLVESGRTRLMVRRQLAANIVDTVYERSANAWTISTPLEGAFVRSMRFYGDSLLLSRDGFVVYFDEQWNELRLDADYGDGKIANPNDAFLDDSGVLWVGDQEFGVIETPRVFDYRIYLPDGPRTNNVEDIAFIGDRILMATGGKTEAWGNTFLIDGVFYREPSGAWGEYSSRFIPELDLVRDYIRLTVDKRNDNKFFVASLGQGVLEFEGEEYLGNYMNTNSSLQLAIGSNDYVGTTGLDMDASGNLWVANTLTNKAISVKSRDGEWRAFDFAGLIDVETTGDLVVAESGFKWVTLPNKGPGILVFDDNGTPFDLSDDQATVLNSSSGSGGLPSSNIYSIAEDLDGEMWVGTDQGVAVFYSAGSIFSNTNSDAQRPLVERDGFLQYLLESEIVTSIAVDEANRKWFGTENSGVFLMNAQGTEELLHFTKENSPLLSNKIKTIAVNPEDGEVLIGTDKGLIAYRGTATASDELYNNVLAYPNPVNPEYSGNIAIKGLAINSYVKITDLSGNMVFETYSEGGQAIWNGKQMNGADVAPGIYLVFASDEDGVESEVTKILMMR